jgi:two-component system C4-dicarboxylate transport sensor histidine kinase DctB
MSQARRATRLVTPPAEQHRLAELGLMSASLLHELRQPLFALKALAQLASERPDRAAQQLERMREQIETLELLVEGYGDFSRRPTSSDEMFDLRAPVRSALAIAEHGAARCGVTLSAVLGEGSLVRGSPLAVQQAIVNLAKNAIDAVRGQDGGRVDIRVDRSDIRVADNGPGLPDEIRAHLFEPFWTTKPGGTGLGLMLTRGLVEQCGGVLELEPSPGTAWRIRLRAAG